MSSTNILQYSRSHPCDLDVFPKVKYFNSLIVSTIDRCASTFIIQSNDFEQKTGNCIRIRSDNSMKKSHFFQETNYNTKIKYKYRDTVL